jgi:hypothetical protein
MTTPLLSSERAYAISLCDDRASQRRHDHVAVAVAWAAHGSQAIGLAPRLEYHTIVACRFRRNAAQIASSPTRLHQDDRTDHPVPSNYVCRARSVSVGPT